MNITERFLNYTKFDTQSAEDSPAVPSTPKQLVFARYLKDELEREGLHEVEMDAKGYIYATLPANTGGDIPTIGFISHYDTSPDCPGANIRPRIVEHYDGKEIILSEGIVLSPRKFPELLAHEGEDLIVTDGHTLLGADDKAGIAEIVQAMVWLQEHPDFDWEQDCRDAKAVADAMKAEGWTFASHTYGHLNAESCDLEHLQNDHERWKTVNSPILGEIDKIIFAFGADIGLVGGYTQDNAKFQYFKNEGINIFCNVDGNIGWTEFGDTFMRTGRVALDGFTMYQAMTESAAAHSIYANDYEKLGIHDIASFFNQYRPTPIDSE